MSGQPHIIQRAEVELNTHEWPDVAAIKEWVHSQLMESLDEVLTGLSEGENWLVIDKLSLQLNLPTITTGNWQAAKPVLKQQLQKAIQQSLEQANNGTRQNEAARSFQQLIQYLQQGWLPGLQDASRLKQWTNAQQERPAFSFDEWQLLAGVLENKNAFQRFAQWLQMPTQLNFWLRHLLASDAVDGRSWFSVWQPMIEGLPVSKEIKYAQWQLVLAHRNASVAEQIAHFSASVQRTLPENYQPADYLKKFPIISKMMEGQDKSFGENPNENISPAIDGNSQKMPFTTVTQGMEVPNAGLVLLAPFLPQLFRTVQLNPIASPEESTTAVMLLHYLATANTIAEDWELAVPKLLCGVPLQNACGGALSLSEGMKDEAAALINAAIAHWDKLGNTSAEGLRQSFIRRSGRLVVQESTAELHIVETTVDILLQFVPWNFRMIRLPWMQHLLTVNWDK